MSPPRFPCATPLSSHKRHPSRSLCSKTIFDGEEGYSFSSTSQNTSEWGLLNLFKVNRGSKLHYHCTFSSFLTIRRATQSFAQNHFRYVSLPHNIRNICCNVSFKRKALFCRMKQGKQKHGTEEREMKWGERICCFCEKEGKREKVIWDFSDSNQGPIDLQSNALPAAPKSHSCYPFPLQLCSTRSSLPFSLILCSFFLFLFL